MSMYPRKPATWMQQLDERILEHAASEGWVSPATMATAPEFDAREGRLRDRCRMLQFAGLIVPIHGDMYELTKWGRRWLRGDLDARHQPVPSVERVLRG